MVARSNHGGASERAGTNTQRVGDYLSAMKTWCKDVLRRAFPDRSRLSLSLIAIDSFLAIYRPVCIVISNSPDRSVMSNTKEIQTGFPENGPV